MITTKRSHPLEIRILREKQHNPEHRLVVDISGQRRQALLLVSIDKENRAERNTVLFTKPRDVIGLLRPSVREEWDAFSRSFAAYRQKWKIGGVPAFKRADRMYRNGEILSGFDLATVVHHFGAVPVLIVGHVEGYQVGMLAESSGNENTRAVYSDDECWELLYSLEQFLPLMLPAYCQQIANYLRAVFFVAQDHSIIPFCLRIRQIATSSIRGKLDSIENPDYPKGKSGALARTIAEKFGPSIMVGRGVDAFSHLLVNYIYHFYCIKDRIADYETRLASIHSSRTLFSEDPVYFMQECARNLENPQDGFRKRIERDKEKRDPWLQTMGEMSTFIAEIVYSLRGKDIDAPRVFLTHHFKVAESERFVDLGSKAAQVTENGMPVEIVVGRHLDDEDIRWSLLARIWMADHHLLFLPSSWARIDAKQKKLRPEKNWVVMELLYSRLLGRNLSLVTASPENDDVLHQFRRHIEEYTEEKEIPHIAEAGWQEFVKRTKGEIADLCHSAHRTPCNLDAFETEFWPKFEQHVVQKAARHLVRVLFAAWYCFFDAQRWSIVQALLLLARETTGPVTVRQIGSVLIDEAREGTSFHWARSYEDRKSLERAIRSHLGGPKVFGTLRQFAFVLRGEPFHPVVAHRRGIRNEVLLRVEDLYLRLCSRFGLSADSAEYVGIVQDLMAGRPED